MIVEFKKPGIIGKISIVVGLLLILFSLAFSLDIGTVVLGVTLVAFPLIANTYVLS